VAAQDRHAQLVLDLAEFRQRRCCVEAEEGQDWTFELLGQGVPPKIGTVKYTIMDV
jgi:hypothetical protein